MFKLKYMYPTFLYSKMIKQTFKIHNLLHIKGGNYKYKPPENITVFQKRKIFNL